MKEERGLNADEICEEIEKAVRDRVEGVEAIKAGKIYYRYRIDKHKWVTFKDGRPKEKLRKFISDGANTLSKVNNKSRKDNVQLLINFYENENGGIDGLLKQFIDEILKYK